MCDILKPLPSLWPIDQPRFLEASRFLEDLMLVLEMKLPKDHPFLSKLDDVWNYIDGTLEKALKSNIPK